MRAATYIPVDSAVVQTSRLGGNFAYTTVESKAYAAVAPVAYQVMLPSREVPFKGELDGTSNSIISLNTTIQSSEHN